MAHVWRLKVSQPNRWYIWLDAEPTLSATWSYITSIMTTNVQHLSSIDFYSHNDMDMMEIGNGDLTMEEQRSHFAVWAFMKSPILLGTNVRRVSLTTVYAIFYLLICYLALCTVRGPNLHYNKLGATRLSPRCDRRHACLTVHFVHVRDHKSSTVLLRDIIEGHTCIHREHRS